MFETVAWLLGSSLKMLAAQHELCIMKHKTSRHPHWFALEVRHPHFEDKLISFELFLKQWFGAAIILRCGSQVFQAFLSHSSSLPQRCNVAAANSLQVFQAVKPKITKQKCSTSSWIMWSVFSNNQNQGVCGISCFNGFRYSIFKILLQLILSNHLIACFWFLLGDEGSMGDTEQFPNASWVDAMQLKGRSVAYQLLTSVDTPKQKNEKSS